MEFTWPYLLSFSRQLLGSVANPWHNNDPVYQANVAGIRKKYNCASQFPNYWTVAKKPSIDLLHKNFQNEQLNSTRFLVFPEGISNSSRFPVFWEVVDTLDFLASTMEVLKTRLNTEARFYGLGLGTYRLQYGLGRVLGLEGPGLGSCIDDFIGINLKHKKLTTVIIRNKLITIYTQLMIN